MKKLVIKDIARLAGVSRSTVSKAINNYSDIPEETKKKIQKIIEENNYRPSKSAQILRGGSNETVAFMSGRIASHFTVEILSAIERRTFGVKKFVHGVIPYSTNYDKKITKDIFEKILYGREVSALIALAMNPDPGIVLKYKKVGMPLVLIENVTKNAHCVNTDNRKAGSMAAEYLLKKGRKKIGLICGGLEEGSPAGYSYASVERKTGFDEALKAHGIKPSVKMLELASAYTIEEGMEIFDRFMEKGAGLDAVFCASGDMTAIGVMEAAKKHGLNIPDDLAVIGFDDAGTSAFLNPPLTTIRQPIDVLGSNVLDIAAEAVDGKLKSFKNVILSPELILRQSA